MSKNTFDVVIIGNNLESLLLANQLKNNGKKIVIIDTNAKPAETIFEDYVHNFHSENKPENIFSIASTEIEKDIQTFESAKWQSFLGFGSTPPAFLDALVPYVQNKKQRWNVSYSALLDSLTQTVSDDIIYAAKISAFTVVDGKITTVTVNDSKILSANAFAISSHVEKLVDWFQPDQLGKKLFQKLAKTVFWTRLELNVKHDEQEVCLDKDHLLSGSTENAIPLFGGFYRNPEGFLCSQWISFLSAELTDDSEEAGNVIREMKRQIKRAYPQAFEGLVFEKIKVVPYAEANVAIDLNKNQTIGDIDNLFISSGQFTGICGNSGKLVQASLASNAIITFLAEQQNSAET